MLHVSTKLLIGRRSPVFPWLYYKKSWLLVAFQSSKKRWHHIFSSKSLGSDIQLKKKKSITAIKNLILKSNWLWILVLSTVFSHLQHTPSMLYHSHSMTEECVLNMFRLQSSKAFFASIFSPFKEWIVRRIDSWRIKRHEGLPQGRKSCISNDLDLICQLGISSKHRNIYIITAPLPSYHTTLFQKSY